MVIAAFSLYQLFNRLPEVLFTKSVSTILLAFFPLFGILIVECVGFLLVFQMWWWRDYLKKKYGPTSYQRIFLIGLGGIIWVLTVAFNQFTAFYKSSPSFWSTSDLNLLATPLDTLLIPVASILLFIKIILGYAFLAFGLLMFGRALQVFGFDYLAVVYLYFPEEGEIQENEIYSVIRHPRICRSINNRIGRYNLYTHGIFFYFICVFSPWLLHPRAFCRRTGTYPTLWRFLCRIL